MKKLQWAVCLILLNLFFYSISFAQQIDRVVAVVGSEVILLSQVEAQYRMMKNQSTDLPVDARCLILDQLLSSALIACKAERDSVTVMSEEVDLQIDSRIQQIIDYMGGVEKFVQYYGKTPIEVKEDMFDDMEAQLVVQKMQGNIMNSVSITPKEVKDFFNKIPKKDRPYFNSEVELIEIIVNPTVSKKEDRQAFNLADSLQKVLVKDSSAFCELAKKYSQDYSCNLKCGDLGMVPRNTFVQEFEEVAYQLDKGQISEVVKTEFGYHIIQLIERLGNNIHCRHILITPEITEKDEQRAAAKLDSIRTLILQDSLTFRQAVQKFTEDETSKTQNGSLVNMQTGQPFFEKAELPTEIYFAIDGLDVGEITKPIPLNDGRGNTYFKIIKIARIVTAHAADMSKDYAKIKNAALESKKAKHMDTWIADNINNFYVEIKPDLFDIKVGGETYFTKCVLLDKWLTKKP